MSIETLIYEFILLDSSNRVDYKNKILKIKHQNKCKALLTSTKNQVLAKDTQNIDSTKVEVRERAFDFFLTNLNKNGKISRIRNN